MKKLIFLFGVLLPVSLFAQPEQKHQNFMDSITKEFDKFQHSINQTFNAFRDSINNVFAKSLEEKWEQFQVLAKIPVPIKPNPKTPPVVDTSRKEMPKPQEVPIQEDVPPKEPAPPVPPKEQPPFIEEPIPENLNYQPVNLWKTSFKIPYPIELKTLRLKDNSEKSVSKFWSDINRTNYKIAINELIKICSNCRLNDYGLAKLCYEFAKNIFPPKENLQEEANVLVVFLLNQLLTDAKIVRTSMGLEPVFASEQTVYATPYVNIENKTYYFLFTSNEPKSIYTYKTPFPEKTTNVDFNVYQAVNISKTVNEKNLAIKSLNKTVKLAYSESAIEYYRHYPQVDAYVNANAAVSNVFRESIINQFTPLLSGKSEVEAVNVLLNFIQYGFAYKTDPEQFGYEKWNFCEENLYYPYNDCDDRAILFSYLVRELLHLEVVLLEFSDHMSTAVKFNTTINGDYIVVNGKHYTICDPTYIGSITGMNPEKYKLEKVKVIFTQNR